MLTILDHPLVHRDITILRDRETSPDVFRSAMDRASIALAYEATRAFPMREYTVHTPLEQTTGYTLFSSVCIISILRAGLGLVSGPLALIPDATQGHIGLYRDENTHQPVSYYKRFPPNIEDAHILLVDPMLATGGSAIEALTQIKAAGGRFITFVCLIAVQAGVDALQDIHPDIPIVTAALDRELDERAFIRPGLGDAGDRLFGT